MAFTAMNAAWNYSGNITEKIRSANSLIAFGGGFLCRLAFFHLMGTDPCLYTVPYCPGAICAVQDRDTA